MRNVNLRCVLKNFFGVVEDWTRSSLSADSKMLPSRPVSAAAVYFLTVVVYSCLNGWKWFPGLRDQGKGKAVLGKLRRLGGRERLGLD